MDARFKEEQKKHKKEMEIMKSSANKALTAFKNKCDENVDLYIKSFEDDLEKLEQKHHTEKAQTEQIHQTEMKNQKEKMERRHRTEMQNKNEEHNRVISGLSKLFSKYNCEDTRNLQGKRSQQMEEEPDSVLNEKEKHCREITAAKETTSQKTNTWQRRLCNPITATVVPFEETLIITLD